MAATVLGKRSRRALDAEDISLPLPSRKRQTRCSTPQIYEDGSVASTTAVVEALAESKAAQSPRHDSRRTTKSSISRSTRSKRAVHTKTTANTHDNDVQICDENVAPVADTPSTIRFEDALGLKTPTTPRHRVRLVGTPLGLQTPRCSTPKARGQTAFAAARQLFTQSSNPKKLVGREIERGQLHDFISNAISSRSGGCTYVSGPPGTGKSALVQEVFQRYEADDNVQISIINCVSLRSSTEVYGKLLEDLAPGTSVGKATPKRFLEKLFLNKSATKSNLILLDEIDNLLDSDCDVLYTIFEWAMHRASSVILVGIANALDLTDRFLPRLKARGLKPQLLPFLPYNATQVSGIISDKLRSLLPENTSKSHDFVPFMQPAAIQLCGKKIASQTGDLRKAFGLVRRVIEQLEKESVETQVSQSPIKLPLGEISNLLTPQSSPIKFISTSIEQSPVNTFSAETAPRASIAHVARVASSIFNNGTVSRLSGLNLQQKAVLCSLVSGEKRKAERDPYLTPSKSTNRIPTVKDLFVKYSMLCKRDEGLLQPLKDTEFRDVVTSLETLGLVHEQKGRSSSLLTPTNTPSRSGRSQDDKQIVSAVSEREMRESLSGAGADLLGRLLDEA